MPPPIIPQDKLSLWRLRFVENLKNNDEALIKFSHPYLRFAVASLLPLEKIIEVFGTPESFDEFYFILIPNNVEIPTECKKLTDELKWKKVSFKEDKLFWKPGKAILQIAGLNVNKFFQSLIEFSFYEAELRKLEKETNEKWAIVERDIELTHQVKFSSIKQSRHVNEMTHQVTLQRMRYVRMRGLLEEASYSSQLLEQLDCERRLDSLEDQLEIYEDVYELANDRISEFKSFHVEAKLEIYVILLLLAEVVIMIFELYVMGKHS